MFMVRGHGSEHTTHSTESGFRFRVQFRDRRREGGGAMPRGQDLRRVDMDRSSEFINIRKRERRAEIRRDRIARRVTAERSASL